MKEVKENDAELEIEKEVKENEAELEIEKGERKETNC